MDVHLNKRLNKQGVIFVLLHTLILFNLTLDFYFIH